MNVNKYKGVTDVVAPFLVPTASLRLEELFVFPFPCESQFPFGRSRRRFNVMQWDSEMRVVSGSGARPNGMVHLLNVSDCPCGLCVDR